METIEFRTSPDGVVHYKVEGQEEKRLTKFSRDVVVPVLAMVAERFPACHAALVELYGDMPKKSKESREFAMVDRFVRCNFGEHDLLTQDIEYDIMNFEMVRCPLRGVCPHENVICRPKGKTSLSRAETEVARACSTGMRYDEVARALDKNPNTVKSQILKIRQKLHLDSSRGIIKAVKMFNL